MWYPIHSGTIMWYPIHSGTTSIQSSLTQVEDPSYTSLSNLTHHGFQPTQVLPFFNPLSHYWFKLTGTTSLQPTLTLVDGRGTRLALV